MEPPMHGGYWVHNHYLCIFKIKSHFLSTYMDQASIKSIRGHSPISRGSRNWLLLKWWVQDFTKIQTIILCVKWHLNALHVWNLLNHITNLPYQIEWWLIDVPEAPWKHIQIVSRAETLFRSLTWMDFQSPTSWWISPNVYSFLKYYCGLLYIHHQRWRVFEVIKP
jgi:hypothetical protein